MAITTYDMTTPAGQAKHAENQRRYAEHLAKVAASRASHSKLFNTVRAISLAIPAAAGGAVLLGAGAGGAAGGAASAAGTGAATLPAAATAGMLPASVASGAGMGIPWWGVASKGADTLFGIYGAKKNQSANREALAYQDRANQQAMAFEREQMAEARRQFDIQQAAAKEALAAQNKFEGDRFAASEEERLYNRRLLDERETRRAPYRLASAAALERIPGILASGRTSPGLASLGSYRRS